MTILLYIFVNLAMVTCVFLGGSKILMFLAIRAPLRTRSRSLEFSCLSLAGLLSHFRAYIIMPPGVLLVYEGSKCALLV